jgi:hypothetical protein
MLPSLAQAPVRHRDDIGYSVSIPTDATNGLRLKPVNFELPTGRDLQP